jgi:hypothetical protein
LQKRAGRTPWAGRLKWRCGRGRAALLDRQMWIQREERHRALSKSTATYGCAGDERRESDRVLPSLHARTHKIFEGNKESLAPGSRARVPWPTEVARDCPTAAALNPAHAPVDVRTRKSSRRRGGLPSRSTCSLTSLTACTMTLPTSSAYTPSARPGATRCCP